VSTFKLLVAAVAALLFLYLVFTFITPLFEQKVNLSSASEGILLDAQNNLGKSNSIEVKLKSGQTVNARNLDSISRTVAFTCLGEGCCPFVENCQKALSVSEEILLVNENIQTTLSARCEQKTGIHACQLYVGNTPAQLEWKNTILPTELSVSANNLIHGTLLNTGDLGTENVIITLKLYQKQFTNGFETENKEFENKLTFQELKRKATISFSIPLTVTQPGEYTVFLKATGEEAGTAELSGKLIIIGDAVSNCARDPSRTENGTYDFSIDKCRKKRFCTGCDFTFECKKEWEKAPVSGNTYYDDERGTPDFVYWIYEQKKGEC
jgi:hypothetical protein